MVITCPDTDDILTDVLPTICLTGEEGESCEHSLDDMVGGMMVYTSGTTGQHNYLKYLTLQLFLKGQKVEGSNIFKLLL